jgi:hypothetical protein
MDIDDGPADFPPVQIALFAIDANAIVSVAKSAELATAPKQWPCSRPQRFCYRMKLCGITDNGVVSDT